TWRCARSATRTSRPTPAPGRNGATIPTRRWNAKDPPMTPKKRLFLLGQYLLPHHALSRLIGMAAECRADWFKNPLISWFVRRYQVDMSEAEVGNPHAYEHFNAFFTRALREGTRPLDATPGAILSPADGAISQLGPI